MTSQPLGFSAGHGKFDIGDDTKCLRAQLRRSTVANLLICTPAATLFLLLVLSKCFQSASSVFHIGVVDHQSHQADSHLNFRSVTNTTPAPSQACRRNAQLLLTLASMKAATKHPKRLQARMPARQPNPTCRTSTQAITKRIRMKRRPLRFCHR